MSGRPKVGGEGGSGARSCLSAESGALPSEALVDSRFRGNDGSGRSARESRRFSSFPRKRESTRAGVAGDLPSERESTPYIELWEVPYKRESTGLADHGCAPLGSDMRKPRCG